MDIFTQLAQCFDVVSKLETPDPEIWKRYMKRFARTIVKVLLAYADITKKEFPNYVQDEKTVSAEEVVAANPAEKGFRGALAGGCSMLGLFCSVTRHVAQ